MRRHDLDRSDHHPPPPAAVSRDRLFSQRFDGRPGAHGTIVPDPYTPGNILRRWGGNEFAFLIVKIDGWPDWIGTSFTRHQIGSDPAAIGEMCKVEALHHRHNPRTCGSKGTD